MRSFCPLCIYLVCLYACLSCAGGLGWGICVEDLGGCIILNLQCYTHDFVNYCCGSMPLFSVGLHHVWSSQCLQLHHVTHRALSRIYVGPCPTIVLGYIRFLVIPCHPQGYVLYLCGPMRFLVFRGTLGSEIYVGPCRILVLGCFMF